MKIIIDKIYPELAKRNGVIFHWDNTRVHLVIKKKRLLQRENNRKTKIY